MYFDQKEFGGRVAEIRKLHGLTQEELALKLNISVNHLGYIERGQHGPSIDLIVEIAVMFNVSMDYLVMGQNRERIEQRKKLLDAIKDLTEIAKYL